MTARLAILALVCAVALGAANGPPSAVAPDVPSATRPAPQGYRLFPGDALHIQVFDNPELTSDIRIPANGAVVLPLIDKVDALVGRTIDDLADEITRRLKDGYLHRAEVTITVTEYGPRFAFVMGNVAAPTSVPLNPFERLTAVQAIGRVGGFKDDADRARVHIIRDDAAGNGKIAVAVAADDLSSQEDAVLRPGDIVMVPRQDRIYVIGNVGQPGAVNLPTSESLTVSKAISLAGGFSRFARIDNVQLVRVNQKPISVDVRAVLTGESGAKDPRLQPGDTVFVPESRY